MNRLKLVAVALTFTLALSVSFAQNKKGGKKGAAKAPAGDVAKGKDLFEANCEVCHNADSTEGKVGPGLKGVKDGKLPSGKDATHDQILETVNAGGGGMPAYKELITDQEKEDVVAYVMTL